MVRTRSGLGDGNGNQQPEPCVIERTPWEVPVVGAIKMEKVQELMQSMLDWQMEEIRKLLQENKDQPTAPGVQPEINEEQYLFDKK